MALTVLHTGQSGVERGACRAARSVGISLGGFCSFERRDELGRLPTEVRESLTPCPLKGVRSALRATLELATAVVLAVPDATRARAETGVEALCRRTRELGLSPMIVDPSSDLDLVSAKLRELEKYEPVKVLITGPRRTRWGEGERLGWRIVFHLSLYDGEEPRVLGGVVVGEPSDVP